MEINVTIGAVERAVRIIELTGILHWIDCAVLGYCIQYYFGCFLESRLVRGKPEKSRLVRREFDKSRLVRGKSEKRRLVGGKLGESRLVGGKLGKSRLVRGKRGRFGNEKLRSGRLTGVLVVAATVLERVVREALAPEEFEMTSYGILGTYGWYLGFLFLVRVIFYRVHSWKTPFVILSFCSVYFIGGLLVSMELLLDDRLRGVLGDGVAAGRITLAAYAWPIWICRTEADRNTKRRME